MAKKYTKSTGNFILRGKPVSVENGKIYEKDVLTYSKDYNTINGNLNMISDGGFGVVVNTTPKDEKPISKPETVKTYTLDDIISESVANNIISNEYISNVLISDKKYIELKKSYNDISKISYYGSSNIFIKSEIEDIINRFPAALYIEDISFINYSSPLVIPTSIITNDLGIDITPYTSSYSDYDLKRFTTSFKDYEIVNDVGYVYTLDIINVVVNNDVLYLTLYNYKTGEDYLYYEPTTSHLFIKPKKEKINEFYNSLSYFQKLLLNNQTSPKYTANFIFPEETEYGIVYKNNSLTWPTSDGYNIDITSSSYSMYITELINISNVIDELYGDNLYRMIVHDSIKNLDNCYERQHNEELLEDYIVGGTKIEKIIRLYGRSFDEIKKYSEGISNVNTITYDDIDNLPNNFIRDKVRISGWDNNSYINIPATATTISKIFPNVIEPYKVDYLNNIIEKELILNSKPIFRGKGTIKSIRKIMNMLGIDEDIYQIREYVQYLDNLISPSKLNEIKNLNYNIRQTEIEAQYLINQDRKKNIDYYGINVNTYTKCPTCSSENYIVDENNEDMATCIENKHVFSVSGNTFGYPFNRGNSNSFYFQQKGNWYQETGGYHVDLSGNTLTKDISYGNNPHIGNGKYDNGYDYLDQYTNLFKTDIRNQGYNPSIDISGYTIGFSNTGTTKQDINKIHYIKDNIDLTRKTINSKNICIGIDGDILLQKLNITGGSQTLKETLYNQLKSIVLPYVEQLIPSTAIFDFMLIDKNTPKWLLVDEYCERNIGTLNNYTGRKILKYKNINYFDEFSTGVTQDLLDIVNKEYGDIFTYTGTTTNNIIGFGRELLFIGDNGDCYRDTEPDWVIVEDLILSSTWTNNFLISSGMVEYNNGLCIKNKFSYYSYNKQETGCTCYDIINNITGYTNNGLYILPYTNINKNYNINTTDEQNTLVVDSITDFIESYIYDLATNSYIGYNSGETEERIIYDTNLDKYFRIEHEYDSHNCDINNDSMFAIFNKETNEIYTGSGDYFYLELDDCGVPTGSKYVYLKDINPKSPTYNSTKDILVCEDSEATITITNTKII